MPPESQDLVPLSLRPIFLELAAVGAELELSGEELQALFVEMDLPELAITGPAVVKKIQNAPTIVVDHSVVLGSSAAQPQAGRVITATFKHSSGDVIDLRVGDASEPRIASKTLPVVRVAHRPNELGSANSAAETPSKDAAERAEVIGSSDSDDSSQVIGTTSNHPFWSVDRREYVQAGKLELGERVLTYSGDTKRVLSKLARPGPQPVYNLEVFAEHVYYVGKDGVLVHNSQGYIVSVGRNDGQIRAFKDGQLVAIGSDFEKFETDVLKKVANGADINLHQLRQAVSKVPELRDLRIRELATEMPVVIPGSNQWSTAIKQILGRKSHGTDFRVSDYKTAELLMDSSVGPLPFFASQGAKYKRGFEVHGVEISGNTPWHNLPHIKWKANQTGHIYFTPGG